VIEAGPRRYTHNTRRINRKARVVDRIRDRVSRVRVCRQGSYADDYPSTRVFRNLVRRRILIGDRANRTGVRGRKLQRDETDIRAAIAIADGVFKTCEARQSGCRCKDDLSTNKRNRAIHCAANRYNRQRITVEIKVVCKQRGRIYRNGCATREGTRVIVTGQNRIVAAIEVSEIVIELEGFHLTKGIGPFITIRHVRVTHGCAKIAPARPNDHIVFNTAFVDGRVEPPAPIDEVVAFTTF